MINISSLKWKLLLTRMSIALTVVLSNLAGATSNRCSDLFFSPRNNSLFFDSKNVDERMLQTFSQDTKIDGSIPIPTNISLTFTISEPSHTKQYETTFDVGAIDAQSKDIRKLFGDLKHRAKQHLSKGEVEFGALIVEFVNGTTRVVKFTSNERGHILPEDFNAAVNKSKVLDHSFEVSKMIFIHTHPEKLAGNTGPITPSANDYLFLKDVEDQINWANGIRNMVGVVLPNAAATKNSFFLFRSDGLAWIK